MKSKECHARSKFNKNQCFCSAAQRAARGRLAAPPHCTASLHGAPVGLRAELVAATAADRTEDPAQQPVDDAEGGQDAADDRAARRDEVDEGPVPVAVPDLRPQQHSAVPRVEKAL